jgi:hypothetical protein
MARPKREKDECPSLSESPSSSLSASSFVPLSVEMTKACETCAFAKTTNATWIHECVLKLPPYIAINRQRLVNSTGWCDFHKPK